MPRARDIRPPPRYHQRMRERKTILLTGGNRGLGRATAEVLARGGHRVLLTARDAAQGASARESILAAVPGAAVEVLGLDLGSLDSIRRLAESLRDQPLDVLLHNAGVMQQSHARRTTADGFEETLGVNVLGPMLLTRLLLPMLLLAPAARVVCVSSRLHRPASRGVEVNFDFADPELSTGYQPERAYKNSKLAVLWFTYELARRLPPRPITANALCPGFVPTTAAASASGLTRLLLRYLLPRMPFATSVPSAAANIAELAAGQALEGKSGTYWEDGAQIDSSPESRDPEKARRFFDWACARLGLNADW